ncbi:SRPBCC domain-containing protein [uncultured Sneathiella sp.]|uniref:SRPBCC family protein n=1 Tax=uncultured Sneathiella sp. TaxID=879315 RepID=UPI0030EF5E02|tara:strand:+ start:31949 stop:32470 length:522 start_codon:yes stop_codon:yes gene_type:complete
MQNARSDNLNTFEFVISRNFDASIERMWQAWTDVDQFSQWFGPKGCTLSHCTVDMTVGGGYHCLIAFEGMEVWGKWTFLEIVPPTKLVSIVSFSDETGEALVEHPGMPNWPLKILSTITFEEQGEKTRITVRWTAYEATDIESEAFENGASDMTQGWTGTFDTLEEFLAKNSA